MPRISGVDIPPHKKLRISLTYIYGIGPTNAAQILAQAKVDPEIHANEMNPEEVSRVQKIIDGIPVEGTLRQRVRESIERLKRTGSYRGLRHLHNLPSRGQRTKTNARTLRGRRKTVGALSKELAAKLEESKVAAPAA